MRLKGTGLFDAFNHKRIHVRDRAIFTALYQMADGVLKRGAGGDKRLWQSEHLLKRHVADHQTQVAVINGERLGDQVEACRRHRLGLVFTAVHKCPLITASTGMGRGPSLICMLLQFVRFVKTSRIS